jgi:hypothetical protein
MIPSEMPPRGSNPDGPTPRHVTKTAAVKPATRLPECPRCGLGLSAFLTLKEAAACLNVPFATVERWAHRERRFPLTRIGVGQRPRVRVLHADFESALIRRPEPARPATP